VVLDPDKAWPIVQQAILAFRAKVPDMAHGRHALAEVLHTGAWSSYDSPTGKRVAYEDFAEWVTKPVPTGLETTVENVWEIAKGDDELTRELERVGLKPLGDPKGGRPKGNLSTHKVSNPGSETYIVRRLKRDRPDLAELVLDGKVSARAAGIAAGFVKRTLTVPADDPDRLAATLRRHLKPEAIDRLADLLRGG
jgi:hypothetical protein